MAIKKIIGSNFDDFREFCKKDGDNPFLMLRKARLIPTSKFGLEMSLTSVFLSAVKLVKEFRENFLSEIGMSATGKTYVYTEVTFPNQSAEKRIDGMIITVKGNKISDAALLEMKNGNNSLSKEQVEDYIKIAKEWGISRLITISNEYVLHPTQSPLKIKLPKDFALYHFSWTNILTIARLLLFKSKSTPNGKIDDADQIEIMNEVVAYWESDGSGVCGFTSMKDSWKRTGEAIAKNLTLSADDTRDAITSWHQEEKDMALKLSRELGVLVKIKNAKSKKTFSELIEDTAREFGISKQLKSQLCIKDAVSDIDITADASQKKIKMSVSLDAPSDKGSKGKVSWIKKQVENCIDKIAKINNPAIFDEKFFAALAKDIVIFVGVKHSRSMLGFSLRDLDDRFDQLKDKDINRFEIVCDRDLGRDFYAPKKFVEEIEKMLLHFYAGIVQNLTAYRKPAPKIETVSDAEQNTNAE